MIPLFGDWLTISECSNANYLGFVFPILPKDGSLSPKQTELLNPGLSFLDDVKPNLVVIRC